VIFTVTPWIIRRAGLAGAFGLEALACLAFLPLIWKIPDPPLFESGVQTLNRRSRTPRWSTILVVATFFAFWLRDALVFSMSESLADSLGLTGQQLGVLFGIASVVGLVGPAIAARIATESPPTRLVGAALVMTLAVSTIMAIGLSARAFTCATLLMPATGLFTAALLSGLAGGFDATGKLVAICAGAGFASEAIGPAIGGSAMEMGGRAALSGVVLGVSALSVVTGVVASAAGRRRVKGAPAAPPAQSFSSPP
jgi:predicted MFS family arabinose efflux permease